MGTRHATSVECQLLHLRNCLLLWRSHLQSQHLGGGGTKARVETLSQKRQNPNQHRDILNPNQGRTSAEVLKGQCVGKEMEIQVTELVGGHFKSNLYCQPFKTKYLLLNICVYAWVYVHHMYTGTHGNHTRAPVS